MTSKIHIIAEAGTNHNGNIDKAINLAKIAQRCGADSVKYQIIYPEGLYLPGEYDYGHYDIKDVIKIRTDGMLEDEEYNVLAQTCKKLGISISASVFDKRGLELLMKFNPPYIKIASCDLNNIRFLRQIAEYGKKMVISTGMSTLADIDFTINELAKNNFSDIVLLHCVSVYPAELKDTNLQFLETLKSTFEFEVGFSDHTGDSIAASMALAKGATWFEKHFTENKNQKGFDHAYAMEENELEKYIKTLRLAEKALENKVDKISEKEKYTKKRARRSLYAAREINAGELIKDDDILVLRPEGIMDANDIDKLTGKRIKYSIKKYQAFNYDMI